MKRWLATFAIVAVCSAALRADVTVVQTTTIEGGPMAQMGGQVPTPTITFSVKGMKGRFDVDIMGHQVSTLIDLTTHQVTMLHPESRTATVVAAPAQAPKTIDTPNGPVNPSAAEAAVAGMIKDATFKASGRSQTIDGYKCDEYLFSTTLDMSQIGAAGGQQIPPEAAQMMQGAVMAITGSIWVTKDVPGASEWTAFQKTSAAANMASLMSSNAGVPGMDKMSSIMAKLDGLGYLNEMTMTVDGTGQIAEMMKQMGPMHVTTKVTSVKTDALADSLFQVPADYTVSKQ